MSEKITDVGRGIHLAYEEVGGGDGAPLILLSGLGQQLNGWPDGLCAKLAEAGFRVIRFDNRDAGRSTHLDFTPRPLGMFINRFHPDQYVLFDMARDTVGLLDSLGIGSAHLVGMSMGGMIAQTVAARFPDRVLSLTSIFSNTGARKVGRPALATWRMLLTSKPPRTPAEAADAAVRAYRLIGSDGYPFDEASVRALAVDSWGRDPVGATAAARQLAAIFKSGDRTDELRKIKAPTLVLHGDRDLMVHPSGATSTVAVISTARLHTMKGMGHDLPQGAWPELVDQIATHIGEAALRTR